MSDESPEMIELQMSETRDSLTEKINALENHVVGTLHNATSSVTDILDSVKNVVPDTIAGVQDAVTEQVNTTFNISKHTREKPWPMVGGATALGFITGMLLFRRVYVNPIKAGSAESAVSELSPKPVANTLQSSTPRASIKLPGWLDQIVDKLASRMSEEVRKIGELAIDTASASLKQTVETTLPKLLGNVEEQKSSSADGIGTNGYHVVSRM
jgi:ElaB/YqjD/DUF883 family membrane-anchored ribosome-binding protein